VTIEPVNRLDNAVVRFFQPTAPIGNPRATSRSGPGPTARANSLEVVCGAGEPSLAAQVTILPARADSESRARMQIHLRNPLMAIRSSKIKRSSTTANFELPTKSGPSGAPNVLCRPIAAMFGRPPLQ